ncbi:MAG: hypothetical protein PHY56_00075 [Candidatus Omnitrophica bacterium]|nr:hypothetical protein [Candidatus Omnitrophota bacterium]
MPKEYSDDDKYRAIALKVGGEKLGRIGKALGIPTRTLKNWFEVGTNKEFNKMWSEAIVGTLLTRSGPRAVEVINEALNDRFLPLKDKAVIALRVLLVMAQLSEGGRSGRKEVAGDDDTGATPGGNVFNQLIVLAPELATRSANFLNRIIIEGKQAKDKGSVADGPGQPEREGPK